MSREDTNQLNYGDFFTLFQMRAGEDDQKLIIASLTVSRYNNIIPLHFFLEIDWTICFNFLRNKVR